LTENSRVPPRNKAQEKWWYSSNVFLTSTLCWSE